MSRIARLAVKSGGVIPNQIVVLRSRMVAPRIIMSRLYVESFRECLESWESRGRRCQEISREANGEMQNQRLQQSNEQGVKKED